MRNHHDILRSSNREKNRELLQTIRHDTKLGKFHMRNFESQDNMIDEKKSRDKEVEVGESDKKD